MNDRDLENFIVEFASPREATELRLEFIALHKCFGEVIEERDRQSAQLFKLRGITPKNTKILKLMRDEA